MTGQIEGAAVGEVIGAFDCNRYLP
jgi:hypothetical protein